MRRTAKALTATAKSTTLIQMTRRRKQLEISFRTWGGKRRGAGRKPTGVFGRDTRGRPRAGVSHATRPHHEARVPLHVTVRTTAGAPSLRGFAVASEMGKILKRRAQRALPSRVVHFSIQHDHLHMIVEAEDRRALGRGLQGLLSGLARVVNRTAGNHGRLWRDRYHARPLRTPTEVRRGIVYVLNNSRKHQPDAGGAVDAMSSAAWFGGFAERGPLRHDSPPVVPAVSWLLRVGWRRAGGPIRDDEKPAPDATGASRPAAPSGGGAGPV